MINLAFFKSKLFLTLVFILVFSAYSYKVYDFGYDIAVDKVSLEAFQKQEDYRKELSKMERAFNRLERDYLEQKEINRIETEKKTRVVREEIKVYVKDNNLGSCSIGTNGVQRVNDLLKGNTSTSK